MSNAHDMIRQTVENSFRRDDPRERLKTRRVREALTENQALIEGLLSPDGVSRAILEQSGAGEPSSGGDGSPIGKKVVVLGGAEVVELPKLPRTIQDMALFEKATRFTLDDEVVGEIKTILFGGIPVVVTSEGRLLATEKRHTREI